MYNRNKLGLYIYTTCVLLLAPPLSYAGANIADHSSTAEIYNSHDDFLEEDKQLNESYKMLLKALEKKNAVLLRQAQRRWIKWRNQTCLSAQAKTNLRLGSLGSSVRDDCLISLTEQRTNELQHFIKEPKNAIQKKYGFSRANDYTETDNSPRN